MKKIFIAFTIFVSSIAWSSGVRTIDADALRSADATKTYTLPALTGTVMVSTGIIQETPSGTVNGSNVTFTLTQTPAQTATLQVFQDGVLQKGGGTDYSISSSTITMVTAPALGQSLLVVYSRF